MSPISAGSATTESAPPLGIDPARFGARFDREPFVVQHRLSDHPLFALPRLIELAYAFEQATKRRVAPVLTP